MTLTGAQVAEYGIVRLACFTKVDDGHVPSYGPDGCGYTLRGSMEHSLYLTPGGSISFKTHESVHMPVNCVGYLWVKSTYARQGIVLVTNSPVDPGYEGRLTIRLLNTSQEPVYLFHLGGFMMLTVEEMAQRVAPYDGRWQNGT